MLKLPYRNIKGFVIMARKHQDISIYRIAEEAGVSVTTVSRVINRRTGIAEATRAKVNELLQRYNFKPVYPPVRTVKIAVVTPETDFSDYFRKAIKGIYAYARQHRLMTNIILTESYHNESLLEAVRDQQCSGVVALLPEAYRKELETFSTTDLPVVAVDSTFDDSRIGFIDNDSYSGSAEATRYLLGLGHRRIGYLMHDTSTLNHLQRFKGFANTMSAAGIKVEDNWVVNVQPSLEAPDIPMGISTMRRLLEQAPEITAVMAVDDSLALAAMAAIHESGRRIPEDISVVGFDNYPETRLWYPSLTTVEHPIEKAGSLAIEAIHTGLLHPQDWQPPREILPTSLVIRKSTGPAPR